MAQPEKAIIDLLLAAGGVTALVGSRLYFLRAPQTPVLPYVILWRVSSQKIHSLNSASGLGAARLQVDIYAKTNLGAREVGEQIRLALDAFRGVQSGIDVNGVLLLDERDGYDASTELRSYQQDYRLWYNEETE